MLAAGLEGIEHEYPLALPTEENAFELGAEERKRRGIEMLPGQPQGGDPGVRGERLRPPRARRPRLREPAREQDDRVRRLSPPRHRLRTRAVPGGAVGRTPPGGRRDHRILTTRDLAKRRPRDGTSSTPPSPRPPASGRTRSTARSSPAPTSRGARTTFDGQLRQVHQQRLAVPRAAMLRIHEQILQVDPGLAQKRRKVVEEQRESHRLAVASAISTSAYGCSPNRCGRRSPPRPAPPRAPDARSRRARGSARR